MSKPYCRDVINEPLDAPVDQASAWTNRRATEQATRAAHARKKSGRRPRAPDIRRPRSGRGRPPRFRSRRSKNAQHNLLGV